MTEMLSSLIVATMLRELPGMGKISYPSLVPNTEGGLRREQGTVGNQLDNGDAIVTPRLAERYATANIRTIRCQSTWC